MSFDGLNVTSFIRLPEAGNGGRQVSFQGDQRSAREFLVRLSNSAVHDRGVLSGNLRLVIGRDGSATLDGRRFRRTGNQEANALVLDAVEKAYGPRAGGVLSAYLQRTGGTLGSHSLVRLVSACERGMDQGGAEALSASLERAVPKANARLIAGELSSLIANDLRLRTRSAAGRSSFAGAGASHRNQGGSGQSEDGQKVGDGSASAEIDDRRVSVHLADDARQIEPGNEDDDVQQSELSESDAASESDEDEDAASEPDEKRAPRVPLRLPVMTELEDRFNDAPSTLAAAALDLLGGPRVPHLASLAAAAYAEDGDLERLVEFFEHALPSAEAGGAGNAERAYSRHKAHISFIALLAAYEHPLALPLARHWIQDVPQADLPEVRDALNWIPFGGDPTLSAHNVKYADFRGRVLEDGLPEPPKSLNGSLILGSLSGRFENCDLSNNIIRAEVTGSLRFRNDVDLSNSVVVLRPSIEPTGQRGETPEFPTINFAGARLDGASIDLDLGRMYKQWRGGFISETSLLAAIGQQEDGELVSRKCMLSAVASVPDDYPAIKANLMKQVLYFADRAGVLPDAREALIVALWESRALYLADPELSAMIGKIGFLNESLAKGSVEEALAHSARWDEEATHHSLQRQTSLLQNVAMQLISSANIAVFEVEELTDGLKALLALQRTLDDCRELLSDKGADDKELLSAAIDAQLSQIEAQYGRKGFARLVEAWRVNNHGWIADVASEGRDKFTQEERSLLRHYGRFVELIGKRFDERAWSASDHSNSRRSAADSDDAERMSEAVQPNNLRQGERPGPIPARLGLLPPPVFEDADDAGYQPVIIEGLDEDDEIQVDRAMVEALLEPAGEQSGLASDRLGQFPPPVLEAADDAGIVPLIVEELSGDPQARIAPELIGAVLEPESIRQGPGLVEDRPPIEAPPRAAPSGKPAQSLSESARSGFESAGRSIGRKHFGVALARAIAASQQYERAVESEQNADTKSRLKQQMNQQLAEFRAQFKAATGKVVGELESLTVSREIRAALAYINKTVSQLKQPEVPQKTLDACETMKNSAPVKALARDQLVLSPTRYFAVLQVHLTLATHYADHADRARVAVGQAGLKKDALAKATNEVKALEQKARSALAVADAYSTALAGNAWVDGGGDPLKSLSSSVRTIKTRLEAR